MQDMDICLTPDVSEPEEDEDDKRGKKNAEQTEPFVRMSHSHHYGSWTRPRRPRDVRFFADLEEQNNRSDQPFRAKYSKPYERSDRYSKHQTRDYASGRNRFSTDSYHNNRSHKQTTSSSGRNDHVIDPIRRTQSDEPLSSRTSATTATTTAAAAVKSGSRKSSRSGSLSVDTDAKRAYSSFSADGDDDENDAIGRESYQLSSSSSSSVNEKSCDSRSIISTSGGRIKQLKERSKCGDFVSRDESTGHKSLKSESSQRTLLSLSSECARSGRHDSAETAASTDDSGSRLGSESIIAYCGMLEDGHSEGNIDLVHVAAGNGQQHLQKQQEQDEHQKKTGDAAAAAASVAAEPITGPTDNNLCNRYDAASISTITSAEFSHREETDMDISEDERSSCSEERNSRCRRSTSRTPSAASSCSGWNSRTRKFSNWRSESSTSDNVFHDSPSPRKFISRAYQAHCDRQRNNNNNYSDIWSERRDRSFSRSSEVPFRRNYSHISRRLYDFDDYSTPDRDERVNRTLYLGGLSPETTESEIRQLFTKYGEIKSVFIKRVDLSRNTTYGFVKMGNLLQAFNARADLNDHRFHGTDLVIRYGKTYPTSRVWLGNLSHNIDSSRLYQELDRFGAVVKLVHFRASGEALADFESIPGAVEAKNGMRGVILDANGITRSSSLSSSTSSTTSSLSRPPSASTPSPPPALPSHSLPFPLPKADPLLKSEGVGGEGLTTAKNSSTSSSSTMSAVDPKLRGIITDFDDHESNDLLDRASSSFANHRRVQSTYFEDSVPPDSSFSRNQPFSSCVTEVSPFFSSSDESEVDEVQHMHEGRSSIAPDEQQQQQFAHVTRCTIIRATDVADDQRHHQQEAAMAQDDSGTAIMWEERGSSGSAAPMTVMHHHLHRPNAALTVNPGPGAGRRLQPVFSLEPEDLTNKSLIRQDPRLLSRSGVYREKSVFETE